MDNKENNVIKTEKEFNEVIANFYNIFKSSYPMLTDDPVPFDAVKRGDGTRNIALMDGAGGLAHLSIYPCDGEVCADCWQGKLTPIENESVENLQVFFRQMAEYHQKQYVNTLKFKLMSNTLTPADRNAMWLCSFEHGLCFGILCETHPTYRIMPSGKKHYTVTLTYKNVATVMVEADSKEDAIACAENRYHTYKQNYPSGIAVSEYYLDGRAEGGDI